MKFFFKLFILVGFLGSSFVAYKAYDFYQVALQFKTEKLIVDVPPGSTLSRLKSELQKQNVKIDDLSFKIWSRIRAKTHALRAGEYEVTVQNKSIGEILDSLLSANPTFYRFTIKEGHSVYDFMNTVSQLKVSDREKSQFESLLKNFDLIKGLKIYPLENPMDTKRYWLEGFLFPETYTYQKYDTALEIIESILAEFKKRVLPELKGHPWAESPEGRFRILTLASIVEKESGLFEEQPQIASVFWNRLQKKMKLQSDPTTIYGLMPQFDGNLKRVHLTTPSVYNTYTLPELPVGPISNPGIRAIQAVLKPAQTPFIYFVAKGDGTHIFAIDLKSHNQNVRYYQIERRKK
jgi:UPF0755 protein